MDAEAAAYVQDGDAMRELAQLVNQRDGLGDSLPIWLGRENRRAEVHVHTHDAEIGMADHFLGDFEHGIDVEAEFDAFYASIGLDLALGGQIPLNAQSGPG